MLSEREIDKICNDALSKANLENTCRGFVESVRGGSVNNATAMLESIIRVSVSKCLYAALSKL